MPTGHRLRRSAEELASWLVLLRSGVFDPQWYAAQRGRQSTVSWAAAHYVRHGRRAGLSPHPLFEPSWYAPTDWSTRGPDPLATALRHPAAGPLPHPLFDPEIWLTRHPQAAAHRGGPLGHFTATATDGTPMPIPGDLLVPFPGGAPARQGRTATWGEVQALLHAPVPALRLVQPDGELDGTTVLVAADSGWPAAWVSATSALRSAGPGDEVRVLVLLCGASRSDAAVLRSLGVLDRRMVVLDAQCRPESVAPAAARLTAGSRVLLLRAGLQLWPGWTDAAERALLRPGTAAVQLTELGADGRVASVGLRTGPDGGLREARGRCVDDLRRCGELLPVDAGQHGALVLRDGRLLAELDPALSLAQAVTALGPRLRRAEAGEVVVAVGLHAAPAERLRRGVPLLLPAAVPAAGADRWGAPEPLPAGIPARRWVIRTAMPVDPRSLGWGDLYFARRLAGALERLGRQAVVDFRPAAGWPVDPPCDVELVLRGLQPAVPGTPGDRAGPVRLIWVISHPDLVTDDELTSADLVFVASESWAEAAAARTSTPVRPLLQATDPRRFHPPDGAPGPGTPVEPVLFAGNSRGVFRPVVRHLVEAGVEVAVYGAQWARFLGADRVRGEFLPNHRLAGAYAAAGVVLNDHWDDMRSQGFVSNRVFDAAACGARVVSDRIDGMERLFGGLVRTFADRDELVALVRSAPAGFPDDDERRRIGERVGQEHSFDRRAEVLLDAALEVLVGRPGRA